MATPTSYSNWQAFRALTKASLQAIMKSPSAVVFGLAFPLIFILVFGMLGSSGDFHINVAAARGSDTTNPLYGIMKAAPVLHWKHYADSAALTKGLSEGEISATVDIRYSPQTAPAYRVQLAGPASSGADMEQLRGITGQMMQALDPEIGRRMEALGAVGIKQVEVREYKRIDFILPGQLGFSLLAGSVFGTAFVFFNLRQTLVLKRFFATPVRRDVIVLSEGVARMVFQLLTAIVIISIGHYAFGFTLINGAGTFFAMLGLSALAIMVFMGFGFIISSLAKNDSSIPPFANLITLPQFLLAGTFFSTSAFPSWLRPIANALPLSYLNHAMRAVAFEGAGLKAIGWDLLALTGWGIVLYIIAGRVFKWE